MNTTLTLREALTYTADDHAIEADDFAPQPIDAGTWAAAILGRYHPVAPAEQLAFAEMILGPDGWDYANRIIYPVGLSLAALDDLLSEHRAGLLAEAEDAGPPETSAASADAWTWTTDEDA